jgi:hypothetical protein
MADAPAVYGPHKTLYNRFVRWSRMGIFDRIFANPAAESGSPDRVMITARILRRSGRPKVSSKGGLTPSHRPHERPAKTPSCTRFAMAPAGQLSFFSQKDKE